MKQQPTSPTSRWLLLESFGNRLSTLVGLVLVGLVGCDGAQSTFSNAGEASQSINRLFIGMVVGAVVIWCIVIGVAVYAAMSKRTYDRKTTTRVIIVGGAVFPTLVLTCLLSYGLAMIPRIQSPAPEGSVTVEIAGVRWWWRVTYLDYESDTALATRTEAVLANEIMIPVNEPVEFKLTSEDVIHSFWIPALGGKIDMVPGRQTRLKLLPLKTGEFRGVCAEYCGDAHTQMGFIVKVVSREQFDQWLAAQRESSRVSAENKSAGLQVFLSRGCGACHAVRGTAARGVVGPDLTHVGSRATIGAGWLPNDVNSFRNWLQNIKSIKPGVEMPQFDSLSDAELQQLAEFLEGLQ